MNHYTTSYGERVSSSTIEFRIRLAKKKKLHDFKEEHGYVFCEDCGRNDCKPIDCSHDISVDKAKKTGQVELSWDINNITLRGRRCHQKHDKLNIN